MLFRQFVDEDLGCASYLVGDADAGEAVLVDPAYAIEPYVAEAERRGVRITRVLETHTHADHVSGHGRLALEHEVPVSIHREAGAAYAHDPLSDGDEIVVGGVGIRCLHTPGHRPEHCCFLAEGALLTGDSLFVGSVARPDLAVEAREGAEGLFHSLHRLLELHDDVRVYPGHVAGSLCGTGMSSETSSTIGAERRANALLALATVHEFVEVSAGTTTPRPPNMERIVELNRGPFLGAQPSLEAAERDGATVLDVRPAESFAAGHVPGALNVPVSGNGFGTKAGFVLQPGEHVVLHASSQEEAKTAARRLRAVGLLELGGYLVGEDGSERIEPVSVEELDELVASPSVDVIDVREHDEHDAGYIAGTRNVPFRLLRAFGASVSDGRPIVTICESGPRAAIAASVLVAAGVDARPVLDGGIADWQRRGGQLVEFRRCGSQ
jgi:glyoxylase-like metal-dependent hydrolase (beta-lactamase superfamily II)/rhodanese-related sulfurtransferase